MSAEKPECQCALCADERGEPNEAHWRQQEREWKEFQRDNPDPPEMWLLGNYARMVLDRYSNDKASVVRDELIDFFRRGTDGDDLLSVLADMLDPTAKTMWRLDFKRRHRGNPGKLSNDELQYLCFQYEQRVEELTNTRRASPAKTARGELAAEYKMTDEEIRAIIERAQGKRVRKRAGRK
jgi:hypothetical protein